MNEKNTCNRLDVSLQNKYFKEEQTSLPAAGSDSYGGKRRAELLQVFKNKIAFSVVFCQEK